MRPLAMVALTMLVAAACSGGAPAEIEPEPPAEQGFPTGPSAPEGDLAPEVATALERLAPTLAAGALDLEALDVVAASGDARAGWLLADLLRFLPPGPESDAIVSAFAQLTGVDPLEEADVGQTAWNSATDLLIAWDPPAPPNYRQLKGALFLLVEPRWQPFFLDEDSDIDWRLVSWGGVFIDDRPEGDTGPCPGGCIPALDDPALTPAAEGGWYPDGSVVFGVVVGDEAVAFPKNIMEVHEMVNVTIGGRRLGIPYCTLCGSAQAYFTDSVPGFERIVLRTSGLLSRSNKVMYDLSTGSVFDTFTGRALSGPLQDEGLTLEQTTVVTSTWGDWKRDHPGTAIVAEDGGIGRFYPADPLQGRDDDGPIFPVGPVDPRLPVQAQVVGVISPDGTPLAFPADRARSALASGEPVELGGVSLVADAGGFRAERPEGGELPAHQAFWFAWSQFHPDTLLWAGGMDQG